MVMLEIENERVLDARAVVVSLQVDLLISRDCLCQDFARDS
jgi:hypothetical protein